MGKDIQKWADSFMFTAEPNDANEPPKAFLLGGPADPLGQIAACIKMYKGEVVRDLADVTDAERREALEQIQKTVLKMPLEAVSLHFMIDNVHRGITHQWVRQRTAAYAQESTRFAVKEDLKTAVALPVSLREYPSLQEYIEDLKRQRAELGLSERSYNELVDEAWTMATDIQRARFRWDQAVENIHDAYQEMINSGVPAEDARGLMPTNILTRLHYITNLRNMYDMLAVRVSDQAQFEWRQVAMALAVAMRSYGKTQSYWTTITAEQYHGWDDIRQGQILERRWKDVSRTVSIRLSSSWQYEALTNEIKPIEFKIGGPAFGANFDRPSRIGERVRAFHKMGVPSSQWTQGSSEHNIPPIHPEEWLFDPNAARLKSGEEFDIFGNRVSVGTGWHWDDGMLVKATGEPPAGYDLAHWPEDFQTEDTNNTTKEES